MSLFENFPYSNLHELNLDWIIKIIKDFKDTYPDVMEELAKRVLKPTDDPNGQYGFVLMTTGDGSTKWIDLSPEFLKKVNAPIDDPNGEIGDWLISNGDGTTKWESLDEDLNERIAIAVDEWLEAHPEATTTVLDHSLSNKKFIIGTLNYVTPEMFGAIGDGTTDDSAAFDLMLADNCNNILLSNNYFMDDVLNIPDNKVVFGKGTIISDRSITIGNKVIIRDIIFKPTTPITRVNNIPATTNGIDVRLYETDDILLDSIYVKDGVITIDGASHIKIVNSRVDGMDVVGGCVQSFNNAHDIAIEKCVLNGATTNGCYFHTSSNIIVSECDIYQNGHSGVHVPYSKYVDVLSCKIHNHPVYDGIDFNFSADDDVADTKVYSKIYNCKCYNNAATGIYVSGSNVVINGNTCYNNGTEGIKVKPYLNQGHCENIYCINNTTYGNETAETRDMEVLFEIVNNATILMNQITKTRSYTIYMANVNGAICDFIDNAYIQMVDCLNVGKLATIARTDKILPIKDVNTAYWTDLNANNLTDSGIYVLNSNEGNSNFPAAVGSGVSGLLIVINWSSNFIMQIFTRYDAGAIYHRMYWFGAFWTEWTSTAS